LGLPRRLLLLLALMGVGRVVLGMGLGLLRASLFFRAVGLYRRRGSSEGTRREPASLRFDLERMLGRLTEADPKELRATLPRALWGRGGPTHRRESRVGWAKAPERLGTPADAQGLRLTVGSRQYGEPGNGRRGHVRTAPPQGHGRPAPRGGAAASANEAPGEAGAGGSSGARVVACRSGSESPEGAAPASRTVAVTDG